MAASARIQHLRAASSGAAPSSLLPGELGIDEFLEKLFYGFDPGGGGARTVRSLALSKLLRSDVSQSLTTAEKLQAVTNLGGGLVNWTPALLFGGAAPTSAASSGRIQQIGKKVDYAGLVSLTTRGTPTGGATIGGLPVAASGFVGTFGSEYYNGLSGVTLLGGYVSSGAQAITLTNKGATSIAPLTHANLPDGAMLYFAGSYFAT